ncbi:MAG: hypothetical protein GC159_20550 [Phycisphaera sp.]|nr:hypothetical protein [Phycisphaera sp.]
MANADGSVEGKDAPRAGSRRLNRIMISTMALGVLVAATMVRADDAAPKEVVDELHAALISAMKVDGDAAAGYQTRYKIVEPVIDKRFDIPLISRLVLGAEWAKLSEAQRTSFGAIMARYMTANYASKFNSYSGQQFTHKSDAAQGDRAMIVRAEFKSGSGKTRQFDYQIRKGDSGWKIVNVAVDGISDLSLKRAEFGDVLKKNGFDGLITQLEKRIGEMAEGKE